MQPQTAGATNEMAPSGPKAPCKPSFFSRLFGKIRARRRGPQTVPPPASGSHSVDSSSKFPSRNHPPGSTVPKAPTQAKPQQPVILKPLPDIPASTPSSHSWGDISYRACKDSFSERQSPNVPAPFSARVEVADVEVIPTPILVLPPSPFVNTNRYSQATPAPFMLQPRRERIVSISPHPSSISGHLGGDLFDPMATPGTPASSLPLSIKAPQQMGVIGMPDLPLELEYSSIRYQFLLGRNPIGTGVSGKVYLALSPQRPGSQFAVKVIRKGRCINESIPMTQEATNKWEDVTPIYSEGVVAEANFLLSCIENPSLFLVYPEAILQDYNFYYFIMPKYPMSLCDFIERAPEPLTLDTCMWCTQQIVLGLQELHKRSIAHLDIKPLNIMIKSDGYLCLIDFGHSVRIPESQVIPWITCGTSGYRAPELKPSDQNTFIVPTAVDVYSLGRTMLDLYLSSYNLCLENDFHWAIEEVARKSESAAMIISLMMAPVRQRLTLDQVEQLTMLQMRSSNWNQLRLGTASPPRHIADGVEPYR